jgi:hypothetical protein
VRFELTAQKPEVPSQPVPPPPPPAPAPAEAPAAILGPPQLVVLTIAVEEFDGPANQVPAIKHAHKDAGDVADFLTRPLGTMRFPLVDPRPLVGKKATAAEIKQAFDTLDNARMQGQFSRVRGDAVFVMIESHFVSFTNQDDGALVTGFLGCDAKGLDPNALVPAALVANCLGNLVDYAKVVLFVDPLHESRVDAPSWDRAPPTQRALNEWLRTLYRKNVITFVASIDGPSRRYPVNSRGAFAEGIVESLNVRSQIRRAGRPAAGITLYDFDEVVKQKVLDVTEPDQFASGFIPDSVSGRIPLLLPP